MPKILAQIVFSETEEKKRIATRLLQYSVTKAWQKPHILLVRANDTAINSQIALYLLPSKPRITTCA
jgi:hypothetical protein